MLASFMSKSMPSSIHLAKIHRVGIFRLSMVQFLCSLILLLAATPILDNWEAGKAIEPILVTVVLVAGVMAVGKRKRTLWIAVGLALPAFVCKWMHHLWKTPISLECFMILALFFMAFILAQLFLFTLAAPRVSTEVLCAGLSVYMLLGITWGLAYALVSLFTHGSAFVMPAGNEMIGTTSVYFSFITLSTVGYGDIVPVTPVARMLAAAEAITGTLFVAVFIARLVALYTLEPGGEPPKSGNF